MRFTVTYREKDGSRAETVIDAASRTDCVAECRQRGITPMGIQEGGSGKRAASPKANGQDTRSAMGSAGGSGGLTWKIAVPIVIVALGIATWCLWPRAEKPAAPKVKPQAKPMKVEKPVRKPPKVDSKPEPVVTNVPPAKPVNTNTLALKQMTPEERMTHMIKKIEERPPDLTPTSNKVFRTALEITLAGIFTCPLGKPPPPLPRITLSEEIHLDKILDSPNFVTETDSEKAALAKQAVEIAKKELKEYVKKGGDPQDFLTYYHGQLRQAQMEFNESRKQVMTALKEDPELGKAMLQEVNKRLAEKGIMQLVLPQKLKERYGIDE